MCYTCIKEMPVLATCGSGRRLAERRQETKVQFQRNVSVYDREREREEYIIAEYSSHSGLIPGRQRPFSILSSCH